MDLTVFGTASLQQQHALQQQQQQSADDVFASMLNLEGFPSGLPATALPQQQQQQQPQQQPPPGGMPYRPQMQQQPVRHPSQQMGHPQLQHQQPQRMPQQQQRWSASDQQMLMQQKQMSQQTQVFSHMMHQQQQLQPDYQRYPNGSAPGVNGVQQQRQAPESSAGSLSFPSQAGKVAQPQMPPQQQQQQQHRQMQAYLQQQQVQQGVSPIPSTRAPTVGRPPKNKGVPQPSGPQQFANGVAGPIPSQQQQLMYLQQQQQLLLQQQQRRPPQAIRLPQHPGAPGPVAAPIHMSQPQQMPPGPNGPLLATEPVIRMGLLHLPSLMAVMTQHTLQLPHRLAHTMGRVDYGALVMSLKSGLLFETTTAVNNLLIMTNEESIVMPLGRWGTELLDALLELFWSYAWALNNLPSTDPNDAYDEANPLPRLRPILAILDKIPDLTLMPTSTGDSTTAPFHDSQIFHTDILLTILMALRNLALTPEHKHVLGHHHNFRTVLTYIFLGDLPGCPPQFLWTMRQLALDVFVSLGTSFVPADNEAASLIAHGMIDLLKAVDVVPELHNVGGVILDYLSQLMMTRNDQMSRLPIATLASLVDQLVMWILTVQTRNFIGPVVFSVSRPQWQIEGALALLFNMATLCPARQSAAVLIASRPGAIVTLVRWTEMFNLSIGELSLRVLRQLAQEPEVAQLLVVHKVAFYSIMGSLHREHAGMMQHDVYRVRRLHRLVRETLDAIETCE